MARTGNAATEPTTADQHHPVAARGLRLRPPGVVVPADDLADREAGLSGEIDNGKLWAVIGDFGAGPLRMAPGFVTDARLEGDHRVVTFADGTVARERLVARDDEARRIAYSVVGGTVRPAHDDSSMQVFAHGEGLSRFVWIHDVLPDELATPIRTAMEQGLSVIKRTLEPRDARSVVANQGSRCSRQALFKGRMCSSAGPRRSRSISRS